MLVETTHKYDSKEEAQDSLFGLKSIPGYIFGYVRLPLGPNQPFNVVLIFDCAGDNPTLNLSKQRAIENLTLREGAIINPLPTTLTFEQQTMLELLAYPNTPGIHPNEARWRDFARTLLVLPNGASHNQECDKCNGKGGYHFMGCYCR